jgi:hypothetical protein
MQKLQGRQVAKMKDEADKNQKEGDAFLAKNKDKPGVKGNRVGPAVRSRQAGHRSEAEGDGRRQGRLHRHQDRRHQVRQLGRSRPAGHVPAESGCSGLDRRPAADAGRF